MSKRAEQRALEAYPNESFVSEEYADMCRSFFIEGYEQAEKDLALSIDDIEKIHTFLYAIKNNKQDEDIITIHLGRVVSDEVYDQIVKDIVRLLERKYPSDANWYLDS